MSPRPYGSLSDQRQRREELQALMDADRPTTLFSDPIRWARGTDLPKYDRVTQDHLEDQKLLHSLQVQKEFFATLKGAGEGVAKVGKGVGKFVFYVGGTIAAMCFLGPIGLFIFPIISTLERFGSAVNVWVDKQLGPEVAPAVKVRAEDLVDGRPYWEKAPTKEPKAQRAILSPPPRARQKPRECDPSDWNY